MKYKVGDKVRVRKDLQLQKTYGSFLTCNDSMVKKAGLVVTIKECDNVFRRYKIDADDWSWCDEMFEGLAEDVQTDEADKLKYKVGDLVVFEEPLMGIQSDDGFIIKEVFSKYDVRRIIDIDEKNYFVDNFGGTVEVKHKDLECVTRIYSEAVEGEANEITNNSNTIRPGYYQSDMGDVFDIANAYKLDMPLGTAVKYILRAGKKDKAKEIEDLQKAVRCIERAIEIREGQQ